ncbi:uncharacterized protein A1O9_12740 [Exophiala aquamarina CBS 119918]|uniref:CN hydrolase domain-containing protein n=1 Tax=Exophiala aquamarina CBS 119918 TaxID=1182545 RepID=A0A072NV38_9EURO|nr:uncharacterized protein A1O9_12740 [Exophiala aquamarina CBS 119918]KEF51237.1 hypothetical protein A1O9_12740 [Exophiala aquamarina CBS 119918]
MARTIKIAAAQLGPNHLTSRREEVVDGMLRLLVELEMYFEHGNLLASPTTAAFFSEAKNLSMDVSIGFAERTPEGECSTRQSTILLLHTPSSASTAKPTSQGSWILYLIRTQSINSRRDISSQETLASPHSELQPWLRLPLNILTLKIPRSSSEGESRRGDPIFGMIICNDRRWPEAWRCLALQGTEVVFCGYNTQGYCPELAGTSPHKPQSKAEAEAAALVDHLLVMQSNCYLKSVFGVCAAKAGLEDGKFDLIGGSCIIDPKGRILAMAENRGDEVIVADCDLNEVKYGRSAIFDFDRHRRVEAYGLITCQTGVVEPPFL